MATRKKGAAGKTPAAAPIAAEREAEVPGGAAEGTAETQPATLPQTADAPSGEALAANRAGEGEQQSLEQVLGTEDKPVGETPLVIEFGQTGGQVADALVPPVVELGPQEGTISAEVEGASAVPAPRTRVEITLENYHDTVGLSEVEVRTRTAPSRWRIGRQFSRTATPLDLDELSDLEIVALLGDEMLLITAQV